MSGRSPSARRGLLAVAAIALAVGLGGCASPSPQDGPSASTPTVSTTAPTSTVEPAPIPTADPVTSAPTTAEPAPAPAAPAVIDPQHLLPGQAAASPDGAARYEMQGDGNLVVTVGDSPVWASGTVGAPARMDMQGDGNLVVTDSATGEARWSTGTGDQGPSTVSVSDAGVLSVRTVEGKETWNSVAGDLVHPRPAPAPSQPRAAEPQVDRDEGAQQQEEPQQQEPVDSGGAWADQVAAAVAQLPGGGNGGVFHPYGYPGRYSRASTDLNSCETWVNPMTASYELLDVVRHEYGHQLQCRAFGNSQALIVAAGGMTGVERIADAVALQLGARITFYTGAPTDFEWAASERLLAGQRF